MTALNKHFEWLLEFCSLKTAVTQNLWIPMLMSVRRTLVYYNEVQHITIIMCLPTQILAVFEKNLCQIVIPKLSEDVSDLG